MSLITIDAAVRMKLLIKHIAPGGQKEVYNCAVCKCSISGNISAQSHLHGIKHHKAFTKSHFNIKSGTQNSTPRVGVGTQVPAVSKLPNTQNVIPSLNARPQIPEKKFRPQNSIPSVGFRPQVPIRFVNTQNLIRSSCVGQQKTVKYSSSHNSIPSLGVRPQIQERFSSPKNIFSLVGSRPQIPVRFSCTHNSGPSQSFRPQTPVRLTCTHNSTQGGRPQIPVRFPCTHKSIPSLGGRPQIPLRFASTQNLISSLGGKLQMPVRFPCTQNSIPSLHIRPQNAVRFHSLQNSIPSANRPQKSNTSKFLKKQKSFQSVSVRSKKSNQPNFVMKQKSKKSKMVKGKISKSSVAAGVPSLVAEAKEEENLVKSISLGIMKKSDDGSQYRCEVCSKSLNARSQAADHIKAAPHQKKLRKHPTYSHLAMPSTITPSPKNDTTINTNKTSECINNGNINDILQNGIESGLIIIKKIGNLQHFNCNVCNKTLQGNIPMKDHMNSESHMKKLSASTYKENSPPSTSSTTAGSSASQDLVKAQTSGQSSLQLPEEISDILVIHAHESLDSLFN